MNYRKAIARFGIALILALHLEPCVRLINRWMRRMSAHGHHLEFLIDWGGFRAPPEWFDHLTDQYWKWHVTRNPMSWERGVFAALAMPQGSRVLDLCCGGGFITYHFYAGRASSVLAVDFDPKAITHARRNFRASNLEFRCVDIRTDMPPGSFDTVVWNAAIEHFTEAEIAMLLSAIKQRLVATGVLAGYTIIEKATGKSHPDHEYEFKSKQDLANMLQPHFANVLVFDTEWRDIYEERINLYFFASEASLPFDATWGHQLRIGKAPVAAG